MHKEIKENVWFESLLPKCKGYKVTLAKIHGGCSWEGAQGEMKSM